MSLEFPSWIWRYPGRSRQRMLTHSPTRHAMSSCIRVTSRRDVAISWTLREAICRTPRERVSPLNHELRFEPIDFELGRRHRHSVSSGCVPAAASTRPKASTKPMAKRHERHLTSGSRSACDRFAPAAASTSGAATASSVNCRWVGSGRDPHARLRQSLLSGVRAIATAGWEASSTCTQPSTQGPMDLRGALERQPQQRAWRSRST